MKKILLGALAFLLVSVTGLVSASSGSISTPDSNNIVFQTTGPTKVTLPTSGTIPSATSAIAANNVATGNGTGIKDSGLQLVTYGAPLQLNLFLSAGGAGNPSLSSAAHNIGIGYSTLLNLTTGVDNTGVGYFALVHLTSGGENAGLGQGAGYANETGNFNTSVGANSWGSSTFGNGNTALGYNALGSINGGSLNIGLGYQSGANYTGTESNNILIGSLGVVGESNVMRLGNVGSGSGQVNTGYWGNVNIPLSTSINTILYNSAANQIAQITPVASAVVSTSAGGVPSESTTLPAGLIVPGATFTGVLNTVSNLQFTPLTVTTGTLTQSGTLVTFSSLPVISAYDGAFVVPATGVPYYVYYTGSSTTMQASRSQNVASPTTFTLYYFNNTGFISQPSTFAITQTLFPNFQRVQIGSGASANLSVWNHLGSEAFGNGIAIGTGSTALTTSGNPTASQSGTTVTASTSVFTPDSVGRFIRFAEGNTATIRAYTNGTTVTVDKSQTISPGQQFFITGTGGTEAVSIGASGDLSAGNIYVHNSLNMLSHVISNVLDPVSAQDAATKNYVDTQIPSGVVNTVYVDAQAGNDTTGNGSAVKPYATITKAESIITTASATNLYAIREQGFDTEAAIAFKPFISIVGNGPNASRIQVSGGGNNVTLDSSWSSATSPRMSIENVDFVSTNLNFAVTTGSSPLNIKISNVQVGGTSTFTGRSGSDFYYVTNSELGNNVTIQDNLYQSYGNIYDGTVLYRNSSAPAGSFAQFASDLFNGPLNVTAGVGQSITAYVNNSSVVGGSTVTGATANITYTAASYPSAPTLASGGTATPTVIPRTAGGTGANNAATSGTVLRGNGTAFTTSTSTFADTYSANTLLAATSANTVAGLSVGNSKIVATNSSGTLAGRSFTVSVQVFSASGTYTPTTGMQYAIVEMVGGGAGGGGCALTGVSQFCGAAGGSGGEYARGIFSAVTIGASQTVTIGAAGTAGAAGNNTGGTGGTTSLGALMTAVGGAGGGGGAAQGTGSTVLGPSGGGVISPGTGGLFRFSGGSGGTAIVSPVANIINGGAGGSSAFSGGAGPTLNSAGFAAVGYGGGGSGASRTASGAATAGGAGTAGIVVVTEYIIN